MQSTILPRHVALTLFIKHPNRVLWRMLNLRHVRRLCRSSLKESNYTTPNKRPTSRLPLSSLDEPNVNINSLEKTLEAHRDANRASLIRKIDQDGHSTPLASPSISKKQHRQRWRKVVIEDLPPKNIQIARENPFRRRFKSPGEDYAGTNPRLEKQWQTSPDTPDVQRRPWLLAMHLSNGSLESSLPMDMLNGELRAFETYISPSKAENTAVNIAVQDIRTILNRTSKLIDVQVVGSRSTGLAGSLSDLDINVDVSTMRSLPDYDSSRREFMTQLYKHLNTMTQKSDQKFIKLKSIISAARIPIICGTHIQTGLQFQIQCTASAKIHLQYIKNFTTEYPTLRGLFLALKQLLKMHGLDNGVKGGLTSYPLLMMIVTALKMCEGKHQGLTLAQQFLFFLEMYSEIDFYTTGIAVVPPMYFEKALAWVGKGKFAPKLQDYKDADDRDHDYLNTIMDAQKELVAKFASSHPWKMTLQDPTDPWNDLGKSVYRIKDVQATFIASRHALKEAISNWDKQAWSTSTNVIRPVSILAACLEADYRVFEGERNDLRQTVEYLTDCDGAIKVDT